MTKDSLMASSISLEDEVFHREDEALKVWRLAVGYIIVGPWHRCWSPVDPNGVNEHDEMNINEISISMKVFYIIGK